MEKVISCFAKITEKIQKEMIGTDFWWYVKDTWVSTKRIEVIAVIPNDSRFLSKPVKLQAQNVNLQAKLLKLRLWRKEVKSS